MSVKYLFKWLRIHYIMLLTQITTNQGRALYATGQHIKMHQSIVSFASQSRLLIALGTSMAIMPVTKPFVSLFLVKCQSLCRRSHIANPLQNSDSVIPRYLINLEVRFTNILVI